jgi:hypothetical protein
MLSTILNYEIEVITLDAEKPTWKVRNTISPAYQFEKQRIDRWFLFWKRTEYREYITNEKVARIHARRRAFKLAKKLFPEYAVRVFVMFQFPGVAEPSRQCVWENGRYLTHD